MERLAAVVMVLSVLSGCVQKPAPVEPLQYDLASLATAPAFCVSPGANVVAVDCPKWKELNMKSLEAPVKVTVDGCAVTINIPEVVRSVGVCNVLSQQIQDRQRLGFEILRQGK